MLLLFQTLCCFCFTTIILAQNIPQNPCPNYFQYLGYGDQYIGMISLNLGAGTQTLDVRLSQRVDVAPGFSGTVSLFDDDNTTTSNIKSGLPVRYRVDFPTKGVVPKLTMIALNGDVICAGSEYPQPNTLINLQHRLQTNSYVISRPFGNIPTSTRPSVAPVTPAAPIQPAPVRQVPTIRVNPPPQTFVTSTAPLQTAIETLEANCGREGSNIVPFIHLGHTIGVGQFPWLTAIFEKRAGTNFVCGGSLISKSTVISAAHCFRLISLSAERTVIYVGHHNLDEIKETGTQMRNVRTLIIHEEYSANSYPDADIAMLHLEAPVDFTQWVQPICLWSDNFGIISPGQKASVAGWGGDERGRAVTNLPKMVEAEIVTERTCWNSGFYINITTARTICAGNLDGSGPCMGDSGGGLMLKRGDVWVLRGIVSAGQKSGNTCKLTDYVVYCDLAAHATWIRNNMLY